VEWHPLDAKVRNFASNERNYDYRVPTLYESTVDDGRRGYFRADFSDAVDIVRAEIDYR